MHPSADATLDSARADAFMTDEQRDFALEAAQVGTWSIDPVTDRVVVDERTAALYGFSPDEADHRSAFLERTHRDDHRRVQQAHVRALDPASGGDLDVAYRVVRPDGQVRWVEARGRATFRGDGDARRAVRLSGIVRDVTAQNLTQRALRKSEEHLRIAVESAALGMWSVDPKSQEVFADERVFDLFGVEGHTRAPLEQFVEKMHPDDREQASATIGRSLDPDCPDDSYHIAYRVRPRPGVERWIEARGETIFEGDAGRQAVHFSGILRDVTEQKRVEQALRESEENLRVALDASRMGFWVIDPGTGHTLVDARVAELFGMDEPLPERLEPYLEKIHPADRDHVVGAIERSLDPDCPGDTYGAVYRVRVGRGVERWIEACGETLFAAEDGTRRAVRFTGVLRDVTEQKQTEEALRRSEAHHRIALDAAELGTWSIGFDDETLTLDSRAQRLLGLASERVALEAGFARIHPSDVANVRRVIQSARQATDTSTHGVTHRIMLPGGAQRWVESRGRVFFDGESARPMHFTGTIRDVSEQRRTTEALAESEARLRTLFERIDEGYCLAEIIVGGDGTPASYRFLEVNPLFETLTGLKDAAGRTVHELLPDIERYWVDTYARVAFSGETLRFEQESPAMGMWFDVFATPVEPRGRFALVFRNITERRRAEDAVRRREAELRALNETLEARVAERTDQLEQRNRDLRDFAYAASHDLQEPLRKISTFAGMLADDYSADLDEDGRYFVDRVQNAAQRLSALVRDLLAYSRVGTQGTSAEPVDLEAVAAQVVDDLSIAIHEARADVRVGPLATVAADPAQMRQLLQNLIENAVKYRREGEPPHVRVWTETDEAVVRLKVADNGIGIAAEYRDQVFAPFGRLHGRDAYSGSGIGLAVCRRIAERHGGTIDFGPTPGGGTTFVVTLPQPA